MADLTNTFCLGGIAFAADYADADLASKTNGLLTELFRLTPPTVAIQPPVRLVLRAGGSLRAPRSATLIESTDGLRIFRDRLSFLLEYGKSAIQVDPGGKLCRGVLANDFWDRPPIEQRRFLLQLFVLSAYRRCQFAIHANAVANGDAGCLFVGQSGSGKSTLSLNFVRSGWNYVTDDVVFLAAEKSRLRAIAVNRHWSCTQQTLDTLSESQRQDIPRMEEGEKRLVPAEAIGDVRIKSSCEPRVIVFPRIVAQKQSQLIEINRAEAVASLIEYSAGILVDREIAPRQLNVLGRLADQSDCFRLLHGRDAQADPTAIPRLLETHLRQNDKDGQPTSSRTTRLTTA